MPTIVNGAGGGAVGGRPRPAAGDEGGEPVEHAVQPEPVGVVGVGGTAVGGARSGADPARQRVGGGVEHPLEHRRRLGPPLRVVLAARPRVRRVLDGERGGPHELDDEGEAGVTVDVVEAEPVERGQLVLVLADRAGPERRPPGAHPRGPRVLGEQDPVLLGDRPHPLPPVPPGRGGPRHGGVRRIQHEVEQLGLARHVGVEAHRRRTDRPGDRADRHRRQAPVVGETDRGGDHRVQVPGPRGSTPRHGSGIPPQQRDAAGGVAAAAAGVGHHNSVLCTSYGVQRMRRHL